MNNKKRVVKVSKIVTVVSLLLFSVMPKAYAKEELGIGVIVGEPSGVSMKYWIDESCAIDAALAVSLSHHNPFQFHADYLMHSGSVKVKESMPWYYGLGARINSHHDETQFGIRMPLGVTCLFSDVPVDLFAEIAPVLDVTPDVNLDINGAIGFHYYFR